MRLPSAGRGLIGAPCGIRPSTDRLRGAAALADRLKGANLHRRIGHLGSADEVLCRTICRGRYRRGDRSFEMYCGGTFEALKQQEERMSKHDSVTKRNRRPKSAKRVDYTARTMAAVKKLEEAAKAKPK